MCICVYIYSDIFTVRAQGHPHNLLIQLQVIILDVVLDLVGYGVRFEEHQVLLYYAIEELHAMTKDSAHGSLSAGMCSFRESRSSFMPASSTVCFGGIAAQIYECALVL